VALDEGDYLIGVELTNGQSDIVLVSNAGKAVWFDEEDVRPMGRGARGVRGMRLQPGQSVISLLVAESDQQTVLVATENGFGKRTVLADFRHSGRGTQGVRAIADSERNGIVVGAKLVNDEDEIMLITTGGVLIRTRVAEIRGMGRATQGVTLISLDDGEKLAGLEKIVETVGEIDAEAEGAGDRQRDGGEYGDGAHVLSSCFGQKKLPMVNWKSTGASMTAPVSGSVRLLRGKPHSKRSGPMGLNQRKPKPQAL